MTKAARYSSVGGSVKEVSLRGTIADEIRRSGPIPFSRYMELCLYGPDGFYSREREQFGKAGDFYTSSDVHAVFGRLLARQFAETWRMFGSPGQITLVELGPGRGLFAQDVLDWSKKKFAEFYGALRYVLIESSEALRGRLQERFQAEDRVQVFASLEQLRLEAGSGVIVFANEFFDSLPVEILDYRGEVHIVEEEGKFVEKFVEPGTEVTRFVDRYSVQPEEHERVEAQLVAQVYMKRIADVASSTAKAAAIFIDYGYTRDEQVAGRHRGTVTCFRQHSIADSPYNAPGEQDITSHVNFTALAGTARDGGLEPIALVTQSQFLMGIGEATQFSDAFEEVQLPQEFAKRSMQLKHLITPEGMGESFHVLVLAKPAEKEKAAQLSGLKFARPADFRI